MNKIVLLVVFVACLFGDSRAQADIFFFGDSLTDTGNIFDLAGTPSAPYFEGRFSNGPTWAEEFAARTGNSAVASRNGGTNYAWGSARTGSNFLLNLQDQVNQYINDGAIGDSDDLFAIWAGSNDIFDAADVAAEGGDAQASILSTLANIAQSMETLQANGAQKFLVINAIPLGQTPFYQALGSETVELLDGLSMNFNEGLVAQNLALENDLGIEITDVDMFSKLLEIQADPTSFGLTNVNASATPFSEISGLATGSPTVDPESYLFWDGIHPTATGHRLIADHVFLTAVPEPSSAVVLALIAVGFCGRRRRA